MAATATMSPHSDEPGWLQILFLSAVGSLALFVIVGFVLGINNNCFTLPIVADLFDEPQFAGDAFVQSLRFYSAGPWLLLSGLGKYVDAYWLYIGLLFLSQSLALAGFLACGSLLGVRALTQRILFTFLLCATPLLRGHSFAGDGGLFVNHFTHSEIANGLTLLLIYFLVRGRLIAALTMNGLIFFDNAFIGVWCAGVTIAIAVALLLQNSIDSRKLIKDSLIGLVIAAILSAPVVWSFLSNPDFGKPVTFDYIAFLEEFWPYHFLFWDIGTIERLGLASLIVLAVSSFLTLGQQARLFLVATAAYIVIYCFGILTPYVTHSSLILNLHILRVGTMLHLMATLGSLSVAIEWWYSKNRALSGVFAPILIVLLCVPTKSASIQPIVVSVAASILILAARFQKVQSLALGTRIDLLYLKPASIGIVVVGFALLAYKHTKENMLETAWVNEWREMGKWADAYTPPTSTFLLPTWNFLGRPPSYPVGSVEDEAVLNSGIFEFVSHRSVWVDFRDGAAVLWTPSYYPLWHSRIVEVNSLSSHESRIVYAKANRIDFVVEACNSNEAVPVYTTGRLCLFSAVRLSTAQ
jgi:hypothetical protein